MLPSPKRAYQFQLNVARQRRIPWEFTYEMWLAWWINQLGPDWQSMRGRKTGQYCMARYGDTGAYNEQNVRCILHTENTKEAAPLMRSKRGKLSKEQVLAIREALGTTREIALSYGVSQSCVSKIRTRQLFGYL